MSLAQDIAAARRSGGTFVFPKLSLDEGYAVARDVWPLLGAPIGWKVGATNEGGQRFLGVDAPIRGRVYRLIEATDAPLVIGPDLAPGDRALEAEPEIVFVVGDPRPRIGVEIVRPSSATPFDDGVGAIVADNAAHVVLVIGPTFDESLLDTPDAITVTLCRNGEVAARGDARAVLGDPRRARDWLAAEETLVAGEWVASGAMTRAAPFGAGDDIVADFGPLGRLALARP